jgi:transposase
MVIVEKQAARIMQLEEQVRRSSRNSSRPPSSDGPAAPARPSKAPSGRKPGGQPGHERHDREPVAPEKVSKIVTCVPQRCEQCGGRLRGQDPEPHRHQVFELPRVEPLVTEYQQHSLDCVECGHTTRGKLPIGVPTGAFGPSVVAVVAVLMGIFRLSKRMVPDLLEDLFGLTMSEGAVVGCQKQASAALEAPVAEAMEHIVEQPVKHADETGWREGPSRARAWLWTVVTPLVVVFLIQARRNSNAAKALLGRAVGVLITDRHGAYNWWSDCRRQFCWAHLKRDLLAIAERGLDSERVGNAMLEEMRRMFAWWHRVGDGTLARSTFQVYMRSVRRRFEALLAEGAGLPHPRTSKTCKKLLDHADALWTFVYIEGVEPTNNAAEQAVRHGVILRKISCGTHAGHGSRFIERILTVHATLRRQQRSALEFVRDACAARLHNRPSPSLLPTLPLPARFATAA